MAKIRELLNDNESVMAFDIDGVLAIMEWGEHNHFGLIDDDWKKACKEKVIEFGEDKVSKTMLKFIQDKDLVTPGLFPITATFLPANLLISVDLPTLGIPITKALISFLDKPFSSLFFWISAVISLVTLTISSVALFNVLSIITT